MALKNCPECGRMISESAASCPGCGFSMREYMEYVNKEKERIERDNAEKQRQIEEEQRIKNQKCPECMQTVGAAKICPFCGYDIEEQEIKKTSQSKTYENIKTLEKETIDNKKSISLEQQSYANSTTNNDFLIGILPIVVIILFLFLIGSCSDSNDDFSEKLDSGLEKYYTGEEMSEQEHDIVESYLEWQDEQNGKHYEDWD